MLGIAERQDHVNISKRHAVNGATNELFGGKRMRQKRTGVDENEASLKNLICKILPRFLFHSWDQIIKTHDNESSNKINTNCNAKNGCNLHNNLQDHNRIN